MKLNSGTRAALSSVSFVDSQFAWAGGDGGVIIHTADGGKTWTRQNTDRRTETNNVIEGVHFLNQQAGWVAGGAGTLIHTADAGQTWEHQKSGTASPLDSLFMLNDLEGWACGGNGALVHTADAGNTWKTQASNVPHSNGMPEPIWDIHFVNSTQGLAAAEFGVILRTMMAAPHGRRSNRDRFFSG